MKTLLPNLFIKNKDLFFVSLFLFSFYLFSLKKMDKIRRTTRDGKIAPNLMGNFTHLDYHDVHKPIHSTPFFSKKSPYFSLGETPLAFNGLNENLLPEPPSQRDCIEFYAKKRIEKVAEEKKKENFTSYSGDNIISFNELLIIIGIFVVSIILIMFKFISEIKNTLDIIARLSSQSYSVSKII